MSLEAVDMTEISEMIISQISPLPKVKSLANISFNEVFNLADSKGDGNGAVDSKEFKMILSVVGLELTDHKIIEVFAKVKKDPSTSTGKDPELNS